MIIAHLNYPGEEHVLLDQCSPLERDKVSARAGFALQTGSYPLLPAESLLTSGAITK